MPANTTHYLRRTLELAEQGQYSCHPNPVVGCVIERDGQVIGEGWHQGAGLPHAEVNALQNARARNNDVRGATVYVSLEPCCNHGRTPPCTDALIAAGVGAVHCATLDPNPAVAGQGLRLLRAAGIEAVVSDNRQLQQEAAWLNRGFFSRMAHQRPWIMLKSAATLDGRTADVHGHSQWISHPQSRQDVQHLRACSSAVLTGSGTLVADNPSLNVRLADTARQPLRVLLDSALQLAPDAKIIGDDKKLVVITCVDDTQRIAALEPRVAAVHVVAAPIELHTVLELLMGYEVNQLMVEAGATLAGAFLQAGLIDELVYYLAPAVLGSHGRSVFELPNAWTLEQRQQFAVHDVQRCATDVKLTLVNPPSKERLNTHLTSARGL